VKQTRVHAVSLSNVWVLALLFATVLAAPLAHASGWFDVGKINDIVIEGEDDGRRAYVMPDAQLNPDGFAGGGWAVRIYGNTPKGKMRVAALLPAKSQNRMVATSSYGGCDDWGRPIGSHISVKQAVQ
jgi:hypothetical protein